MVRDVRLQRRRRRERRDDHILCAAVSGGPLRTAYSCRPRSVRYPCGQSASRESGPVRSAEAIARELRHIALSSFAETLTCTGDLFRNPTRGNPTTAPFLKKKQLRSASSTWSRPRVQSGPAWLSAALHQCTACRVSECCTGQSYRCLLGVAKAAPFALSAGRSRSEPIRHFC